MSAGSKVSWMVVRTVTTVVAVTLTKKALDSGWRFVTGKEPPEKKPTGDSSVSLAETLIWVGASAVGIAAAQVVATKVAANRWQAWTGELPPGPATRDSGDSGNPKGKLAKAKDSKAKALTGKRSKRKKR